VKKQNEIPPPPPSKKAKFRDDHEYDLTSHYQIREVQVGCASVLKKETLSL